MSSVVDICNMALIALSVEPIESDTDTTLQAKLALGMYPVCRDRVLATGHFDFANHNVLLDTPAASPPDFWGYTHYFDLPPDTLRVNTLGKTPDDPIRENEWQQVGMMVATSFAPAYASLVLREEDTLIYPPLFTDAVAALLSAELAMPLTKDRDLYTLRHNVYTQKLSDARGNDRGFRKRADKSMSGIRAARFRGW